MAVAEDELEILENEWSNLYNFLSVDEIFNRDDFWSHEDGSKDDAEVILPHFICLAIGDDAAFEEVKEEEDDLEIRLWELLQALYDEAAILGVGVAVHEDLEHVVGDDRLSKVR